MKSTVAMALVALALLAGCAKAPTEKVNAAEAAVNDAKAAGAPTYLAEDYAKVEGMLVSAKQEISEQDAKMAFLRDYGKAEQLLASAQTEAARVTAEAAKKKEEAKQVALQAQAAAAESVKKAQDLVAKAPVGKDRAAVQAIKADAQGLEMSLNEVKAAIDGGDYQGAQAKAKAIQEKSDLLVNEVEAALSKVGKGKPAKKK
ncbi:MAG TPA: hypothetical protein VFA38_01465 [Nitrospirales bacterium]|nr:hypothetical protein [Nitrospirales bacterium]